MRLKQGNLNNETRVKNLTDNIKELSKSGLLLDIGKRESRIEEYG